MTKIRYDLSRCPSLVADVLGAPLVIELDGCAAVLRPRRMATSGHNRQDIPIFTDAVRLARVSRWLTLGVLVGLLLRAESLR
jgi:hypothetical protein